MSAEKKIAAKKSSLGSTVLDYYQKFGQNRDLEKYLRIKRQNSSKSSSDGSLQNFDRANSAAETERIRRSLKKLCVKEDTSDKISPEHRSKSYESVGKSKNAPKVKKKDSDESSISPEQPQQQKIKVEKKGQFRKKSKSKSYNMNLESNIEISLPPSQSLPELPNQMSRTSFTSPRRICFESCETQTDIEPKPIKEKPKQTKELRRTEMEKHNIPATEDRATETSPASSVASARTRLEWDSGADVGYNKIIDFKSQSNSNLTTFEKNALRKFFAKRGLKFDDNLVIIASPDQNKKLNKHEMAKSAIEIREMRNNEVWNDDKEENAEAKSENRSELHQKVKDNVLWQKAMGKYRQKYLEKKVDLEYIERNDDETSNSRSMSLLNPQGHSTPLTESEISRKIKVNPSKIPDSLEKSCQTSLIGIGVKEVQTSSLPIRSVVETGTQSDMVETISRIEKYTQSSDQDGLSASATSFEYVAADSNRKSSINEADGDAKVSGIEALQNSENSKSENEENKGADRRNLTKPRTIPNECEDINPENPGKPETQIQDIIDQANKENIPPIPIDSEPENDQASKNESCLPNDLQKAVDLLNSLIDSKKLKREDKKALTRKIIRRLMKSKDLTEISRLLLINNANLEEDPNELKRLSKRSDSSTSQSIEMESISGVKPLSASERSRIDANENEKEIKSSSPIKEWLQPLTRSEIERENHRKGKNGNIEPKRAEKKLIAENVKDFLRVEKKNHLEWIGQEIDHLKNLQEIMNKIELNEKPAQNDEKEKLKNVETQYSHRTYASIMESSKTSSDGRQRNQWIHRTTIESTSSSATESVHPSTTDHSIDYREFPDYNSHLNMQQIVKNRTKLETPSSNESIESYAKTCHAKFKQNYAKTQNQLYNSSSSSNSRDKSGQMIYTKPYSSNVYSHSKPNEHNQHTNRRPNEIYSSGSQSGEFLSSKSISISVTENSSTSTTTHQYDTKTSIAAQTTDTLKRMQPIQLRRREHTPPHELNELQNTIRVDKFTQDKQQQVCPQSLAYEITFRDELIKTVKKKATKHRSNKSTHEIISRSSENSNDKPIETFTLQEYFRRSRPNVYSKVECRSKCVHKMNTLRYERSERRKSLLASTSNQATLRKNIKRLLPPQPLAQNRLFSSKDIKAKTRRKYHRLPEVVRKKYEEKENKIRMNYLKLAGIFNKKLQQRVLEGHTDFSTSYMFI